MALAPYYTPTKPYAQRLLSGQRIQNQLYQAIALGHGAPQLPPGEFGANTSAPARVGDPGATSPFSTTRGNLGDLSQGAAPPATSGGGGGGSGGGGFHVAGFEDDPILAKTRAMWARNVADAEAAALAGRKKAEIGYGYDPNYTYADQTTQQAAQQNAFADLANLLYQHTERGRTTDEGLNKSNLFYSGERARQLDREGRQYTLEQTQANQGLQSNLSAIGNALLQTRMAAQQAELQAEEDAYNRAVQFALATGYGGGGGGGGSGGSTGGGGTTTTSTTPNLPVSPDEAKYANSDTYAATVQQHPDWVWYTDANGVTRFGPKP